MSIHIIGKDVDYTILNSQNTLYLNSYTDSQIIRLYTELDDTFINYENKYNVGVRNNDFVINHILGDINLMTFNTHNIHIYSKLNVIKDIVVKDIIETIDNSTSINSNLTINLKGREDSFIINDINNKKIIDIDSHQININSNLYINDGVLYVNRISSIGNNELQIENATYTSAVIESMIFKEKIKIDNSLSSHNTDELSIEINKYKLNSDILRINNILNPETPSVLSRLLTINKEGFIGIGNNNPTAVLSLTNLSQDIIEYNGDKYGDVLNVNEYANVGIGTSIPNGRLHIHRTDDYDGTHVRNQPVLNIGMEYSESKNTSNLVIPDTATYSQITSGDNNDSIVNMNLYLIKVNTNTVNEYIFLTRSIFFDRFLGNIFNLKYFEKDEIISVLGETTYSGFTIKYNLKIPQFETNVAFYILSNNVSESGGNTTLTTTLILYKETLGSVTEYTDTFVTFIDSSGKNTSASLSGDFINKIYEPSSGIIGYGPTTSTTTLTKIFTFHVRLYVQKSNQTNENDFTYTMTYKYIVPTPIPAPDLLYISLNNEHKASISSGGTLSLSSLPPDNTNYLLYSPGESLIDNLVVKNINTVDNILPVNIDKITCTSYQAYSTISSNLYSSNLYSSNIYFQSMSSTYSSFNENLISYNTQCSINTNTIQASTVSIQKDANTYINAYTRNNALLITNKGSKTNPSLTIESTSNLYVPYFVMKNETYSYLLNINNNNLQLSTKMENDDFGKHFIKEGYENGYRPCVYQHVNNGNIFSIGTQGTINIECKTTEVDASINVPSTYIYTNHELHTSIGLPYYSHYYLTDENKRNNSIDFFTNNILKRDMLTPESGESFPERYPTGSTAINDYLNDYTVNVFGNVRIANTSNHSMLSIKDGDIRIADKDNKPIFRIKDGKLYIDCETYFSKAIYAKNQGGGGSYTFINQ